VFQVPQCAPWWQIPLCVQNVTGLPRASTIRGISIRESHQGIAANIFCWVFFVPFFHSKFPSCFRSLSSPSISSALSHRASVFPLHVSPSPPMFTFVSRLLFLFNSPWFSLGFSVLLIFSAAVPFSRLTSHPRVPLGPCFELVLFCLVYWTFPLPCCTAATFFFRVFFFFPLLEATSSSLLLVLFIYVFSFLKK